MLLFSGMKRFAFRLETDAAASPEARLTPDGFDSLALDNVAYLQIPKGRPLSVFTPSTLPAFRRALQVQKGIELVDETKAATGVSFDLIVSDRPEDAKIESEAAMFIGFVPKDLEKLVSIAKGSIDVIDWDRSSPLLQHVLLSDVTAIDQPKIAEGVRDGDFEKLGYTILGLAAPARPVGKAVRGAARILLPAPYRPFNTPVSGGISYLAANLVEIARSSPVWRCP